MQSAMSKCGLVEKATGILTDGNISKEAYVWYEKNWQHDEYEHTHVRAQLIFVEEGFQYVHLQKKVYLVPQHHMAWIPGSVCHKTTSTAKAVNLMTVLFKSVPVNDFYREPHVFRAPRVLREMLLYAAKWNQLPIEYEEEALFLKAILYNLPAFCNESHSLQVPVPADIRLISLCDHINRSYQKPLCIDEMSRIAHMSERSLQRIFKRETGITLQKYVQLIRVLKSMELINSGQFTLSQISSMVGYKSLAAFRLSYTSIIGYKPSLKNREIL